MKKQTLIALCFLGLSCKTQNKSLKKVDQAGPVVHLSEDKEFFLDQELKLKPEIHAISLDEADFRISNFRVGLQVYIKKSAPVLIYDLPESADYVEIMRCSEGVVSYGGRDFLMDLELKAKDLNAETRVYQRNNFWEDLSGLSECKLISNEYRGRVFVDRTADSSPIEYYIRACVQSGRLLGKEKFSNYNCSRQVSKSLAVVLTPSRLPKEKDALVKISELDNKIHGLTSKLEQLIAKLGKEIQACEKKTQEPITTKKDRSQFKEILAGTLGAGVGATALTADVLHTRSRMNASGSVSGARKALNYSASTARAGILGVSTAFLSMSLVDIWTPPPRTSYPYDAAAYCAEQTKNTYASEKDSRFSPFDIDEVCSCSGALATRSEIDRLDKMLKHSLALKDMEEEALDVSSGKSEPSEEENVTPPLTPVDSGENQNDE